MYTNKIFQTHKELLAASQTVLVDQIPFEFIDISDDELDPVALLELPCFYHPDGSDTGTGILVAPICIQANGDGYIVSVYPVYNGVEEIILDLEELPVNVLAKVLDIISTFKN